MESVTFSVRSLEGLPTATPQPECEYRINNKVVNRVVMGLAATYYWQQVDSRFSSLLTTIPYYCTLSDCDNLCICFDYNDGNQTDHDRANGSVIQRL